MPVFTPEYLHKVAYHIYRAKGTPDDEAETVARQSAMKGPGASPKFNSAIAPIEASAATNDVARQRKGMRR